MSTGKEYSLFITGFAPQASIDKVDQILGSQHGELNNILELICHETVEFNLRIEYDFHGDVRKFVENIYA